MNIRIKNNKKGVFYIKTRINVPKEYEETVKKLGAKYDGRMKSFYVPDNIMISVFNKFIPLSIELVPSSNWEKNVRSELKENWDYIRRKVYRNANYKCEICGGKGESHPVEAHEIWSYNMDTGVQKLVSIVALCPMCHKSKHIGFAMVNGQEEIVKKHIMKINNWKKEDVDKYIRETFYIFNKRSSISWKLDLGYLKDNFEIEIK